jgi:hypothetical protein
VASFGGKHFSTLLQEPFVDARWQIRINLLRGNYVNITQSEHLSRQPALLLPFVDLVREVLPVKLIEFEPHADKHVVPLANLTNDTGERTQPRPRYSSTRTVISSDCAAPSVKAATAS